MCAATALMMAASIASACSSSSSSITVPANRDTRPTVDASGVRPDGFDTVEYQVRRADGSVCRLCLYLARTTAQQERGLMHVTDLAGRDGMAFPFDPPAAQRLWMQDTVIPLTALWFDADGRFIQRDDMDPCPRGASNCPTYGPDATSALVIEFPVGRVDELRLGAGSRLVQVWAAGPDSSGPRTCPLGS